jgi:hypothetical protein
MDPQYRSEAHGGFLHSWMHKTASDLEQQLTMGRLLAGGAGVLTGILQLRGCPGWHATSNSPVVASIRAGRLPVFEPNGYFWYA